MNRRELYAVFKASFKDWQADNAALRAAALTFFIIIPLPSLLLIIISFFALFSSQTQATQQLIQQITALAGPAVAELFKELLSGAASPFSSIWAAITVIAFSLAGAIGTFSVLRDTMDVIWEVKRAKTRSFGMRVKQRIGPFILVSALGLIVIAWTGIATTLTGAIPFFSVNGTVTFVLVRIAQVILSFALSTLLFALIFKVIPEVKVHWLDVFLPAAVTGIAFTVTNYILGIYIQIFTVTTIVGAAGSLIIILLWIFILNLIVLFGAELSRVYAGTFGPHPRQHLPASLERIVLPLERAGERLEDATKWVEAETRQETDEKPDSKQTLKNSNKKEPEKVENN